MSRPEDIPQDVWDYAEAVERVWRDLPPREAIEHHARAILAERKRCADLIEKGYRREVATRFRADGQPSKFDQCQHGRHEYEDCESCAAIAIRRPA
jgi:hypothetical protein